VCTSTSYLGLATGDPPDMFGDTQSYGPSLTLPHPRLVDSWYVYLCHRLCDVVVPSLGWIFKIYGEHHKVTVPTVPVITSTVLWHISFFFLAQGYMNRYLADEEHEVLEDGCWMSHGDHVQGEYQEQKSSWRSKRPSSVDSESGEKLERDSATPVSPAVHRFVGYLELENAAWPLEDEKYKVKGRARLILHLVSYQRMIG